MRRFVRYSVRLLVLVALVASFHLLAPPGLGPATRWVCGSSLPGNFCERTIPCG